MVTETDLALSGGRTLHVYDTDGSGARLVVFWHHGTPNMGAPPEPLMAASGRLGIRWVSHDRPGYGSSTARPGRDLASAATDVAAVADALGVERFAVMGHSGGATHALACTALLPDRVIAAACVSAMAPPGAAGLDWFAGMAPSAAARLRAAARGRAALEEHQASAEFDPEEFTPADLAALEGEWSWLARIAGQALRGAPDGPTDDELAYVAPWGFDPERASVPVLFVHGGQDRIAPSGHAEWLAAHRPSAELWLRPDDGHISVLSAGEAALEWLTRQTAASVGPGSAG